MKKALIIVDIQNDFCEGGSLEVANASQAISYINEILEKNYYDEIVLTQDFHPKNHKSFASNNGKKIGDIIELGGIPQVMWPEHCVQGAFGAEFHKNLNVDKATHITRKGMNPEIDSYSAFFDNNHRLKTDLSEYLKSKNIEGLDVVGLALDYCVKNTCLDGVSEGFKVKLIYRGTKPVNLNPYDDALALKELLENGVDIYAS